MKTQIIKVVYVDERSSHPSGIAIMSALVETLGIEIIHSEPYGNMHKLTLHDNIDIEVIRHVLHRAFPYKLSIFREKPKPAEDIPFGSQIVRVSYIKGASITPTAQNIVLVLLNDLGDADAVVPVAVDDEGVTLKLSSDCTISEVSDILNKSFCHCLSILPVAETSESGTTTRYIYVTNAPAKPRAGVIIHALVKGLNVRVTHADSNYDMVIIKLSDAVPCSMINDVLHNAFPDTWAAVHERIRYGSDKPAEPNATDTLDEAYSIFREAAALMKAKNADYGDSWRLMRLSSITDQILVKINRVRTIEESVDAPKVSEGVESEYRDILNYCVFAIIRLREQKP